MVVRIVLVSIAGAAAIGALPALEPNAPTTVLACSSGTYQNVDGQCISDEQAPTGSGPPAGATAICRDGDYSFSRHRTGTCSGHQGVSEWLMY